MHLTLFTKMDFHLPLTVLYPTPAPGSSGNMEHYVATHADSSCLRANSSLPPFLSHTYTKVILVPKPWHIRLALSQMPSFQATTIGYSQHSRVPLILPPEL